MSGHWNFFFSMIDGELGSIFVDLGLQESVPLEGLGDLVWLRLYMKSPRLDGLSSQEEFDTLSAIEGAIEATAAGSAHPFQYVGRCTSAGTRDFFLYASDGRATEQALGAALSAYPNYEFDVGGRPDPEWEAYNRFLYPSDRAWQTIENRKVLELLEKEGNRSEVVREVVHWIGLCEAEARDQFALAATKKGYREVSRSHDAQAEQPFEITVSSQVNVLSATIDSVTLELFDLAHGAGGAYDGWETSVER